MRRIFQLALLLAALAWCLPAHAAAVTLGVNTASSTACSTTFASGAFTPAAKDLLVVVVQASNTVGALTMTSSLNLQFDSITTALNASSANTIYSFVSQTFAQATSQTVSLANCAADATTGQIITVYRVSGMTRSGVAAILQSCKSENQAAAGTPACTFGAAVQTGNPTIGIVGNSSNAAGVTPPTSWTEDPTPDTGYNTPTTGSEVVRRDSGFTGTTITWGGTSASAFGVIGLELDASACTGMCYTFDKEGRSTTSPLTITYTPTTGSLIVVTGFYQGTTDVTPNDSATSTWSCESNSVVVSSNFKLYTCHACSIGAATSFTLSATLSGGTPFIDGVLVEYSGQDSSCYDQVTTKATGTGTTQTSNAATPAVANSLSVGNVVITTNVSPKGTNNYKCVGILESGDNDYSSQCFFTVSGTPSQTVTSSTPSSVTWHNLQSIYKPTSGGGGGATTQPYRLMMGVGK